MSVHPRPPDDYSALVFSLLAEAGLLLLLLLPLPEGQTTRARAHTRAHTAVSLPRSARRLSPSPSLLLSSLARTHTQ